MKVPTLFFPLACCVCHACNACGNGCCEACLNSENGVCGNGAQLCSLNDSVESLKSRYRSLLHLEKEGIKFN